MCLSQRLLRIGRQIRVHTVGASHALQFTSPLPNAHKLSFKLNDGAFEAVRWAIYQKRPKKWCWTFPFNGLNSLRCQKKRNDKIPFAFISMANVIIYGKRIHHKNVRKSRRCALAMACVRSPRLSPASRGLHLNEWKACVNARYVAIARTENKTRIQPRPAIIRLWPFCFFFFSRWMCDVAIVATFEKCTALCAIRYVHATPPLMSLEQQTNIRICVPCER